MKLGSTFNANKLEIEVANFKSIGILEQVRFGKIRRKYCNSQNCKSTQREHVLFVAIMAGMIGLFQQLIKIKAFQNLMKSLHTLLILTI